VAAILDGGRAQVRDSNAAPGVHNPAWIETKVATLSTFTDVRFEEDPQPDPPAKLLERAEVQRLVREMRGSTGKTPAESKPKPVKARRPRAERRPMTEKERGPKRKVRTVVATTKSCEQFGPMVAAEAMRRGFFGAKKKAALGDGSLWIWGLVECLLPGFTSILGFVHLLTHLYSPAHAAFARQPPKAWNLYTKLMRQAWAGEARRLLKELQRRSRRIGAPPKACSQDDPRKILAAAVGCGERNKGRMDYPRYRKEGLPISSAPVESLIKPMNMRVKGSDKLWINDGLQAMLQAPAAHLSQDGRAEAHWAKRPLGPAAASTLFRPKPAAA
jgi:hypothetical protein